MKKIVALALLVMAVVLAMPWARLDSGGGEEEPTPFSVRGLVLAAESGRPLARAEVRLRSAVPLDAGKPIEVSALGDEPAAITELDGRYELQISSRTRECAIVTAEGRAPVLLHLPSHQRQGTNVEDVLEARLSRSARLTGVVIDFRGVDAELDVRLETGTRWLRQSPSLSLLPHGLSWTGRVETNGRFTIEDLPPGAPLRARVLADGEVVLTDPTALSLEPGEEREAEWRIEGGTTFFGRVVDEHGNPLAGKTIWLLPTSEARSTWTQDGWYPTRSEVSDARGQFSFTGLTPGKWTAGAAPEADAVTPCTRLIFPPDEAEAEAVVRLLEGQYIAGRVLGPDGEGAAGVDVSAYHPEEPASFDATTGKDGDFRLGPLPPGEYPVQAVFTGQGTLAPSAPVVVYSGDEEVELLLTLGGRVSGEVVDANTGEPVPLAGVRIHSHDGRDYRLVEDREGGAFDFGGLEAGGYHLIGTTSDGRTGSLRHVQVDPGTRQADLAIPVRRGGHLRLRYKGVPEAVIFTIEQDGVKYVFDVLHGGTEQRVAVPSGELVVRLSGFIRAGRVSSSDQRILDREKKLDVDAGEEVEVVFDLDG